MVSMPEIYFGIDSGFLGRVEYIGDEGERIAILLGDPIEATEVVTKSKQTVLLADEEDRSTVWRSGWTDKANSQIFVNEFP